MFKDILLLLLEEGVVILVYKTFHIQKQVRYLRDLNLQMYTMIKQIIYSWSYIEEVI